jgi:hypothetical protein
VTKDSAKDAFIVLGHYAKAYESRYGIKPTINKYKEKWAAQSFVEDYGIEKVKEVIDFYVSRLSKDKHPIAWLFNNFDNVLQSYESEIKDLELRRERREETMRLRKEWLDGNA